MTALSALFGLTAFIYSLVGFAGGSTYLALLVLFRLPQEAVPVIALSCNSIVAAVGSVHFLRAGLLRSRLLVPHMALAIPCAYIGGMLSISKTHFEWLTALCLLLAAMLLISRFKTYDEMQATSPPPLAIALPAGGILGFISGVIGVGGGIFLAPLLYLLKAGSPKEIASTCSLFILVNSLAGLAGHLHKAEGFADVLIYWPLPAVVFLGGMLGTQLTLRLLALRHIALITGLVLLAVALRLGWQLL